MSEVRRTGPKAVARRLWRSLHRVVAVPVSIGLATLVLEVGSRARVGEVSCAFL